MYIIIINKMRIKSFDKMKRLTYCNKHNIVPVNFILIQSRLLNLARQLPLEWGLEGRWLHWLWSWGLFLL